MSRIAYIISAYKDAPHLSRLIKALDEDADFYVHIDRKADSRPFKELLPEGKVTFVQSHWVSWGGWEQVEYQKELLAAVLHSGIEYTRIVCLSGQDYPLWPNRKIHRYFEEHRDTEFIMGMNLTRSADKRQIAKIVYYHFFRDLKWENLWLKNKFIVASRHLMKWLPIRKAPIVRIGNKESDIYCGSDYWGITLPCAQYVYEKLCTEKELVRYFKTSFVPSELCIQTLVFNSPFAARALSVEGGYTGLSALTPLHYIIYGKSIKVLTLEDWSALQQSGKMFCRKVVSGAVFGCHDRENRTISHEVFLRSEQIYHLTEYANINYSFKKAFGYSVLACVKKSLIALVKGKAKTAGTYVIITTRLLKRTAEVRKFRKQSKLRNANYLQ